MANIEHKDIPATDIHALVRWTWVNEAARLAQGVTASDVHKLGFQESNQTYWYLSDDSPVTWVSPADAASLLGVALDSSVGAANQGDFLLFDGTDWVASKFATVENVGVGLSVGLALQNPTTSTLLLEQASPMLVFAGGWGAGSGMIMCAQLRPDGPVIYGSPDAARELQFFYTEDLISFDKMFGLATNGVGQRLTVYGSPRGEVAFEDGGTIVATTDDIQIHAPAGKPVEFYDDTDLIASLDLTSGLDFADEVGVLRQGDSILLTSAFGTHLCAQTSAHYLLFFAGADLIGGMNQSGGVASWGFSEAFDGTLTVQTQSGDTAGKSIGLIGGPAGGPSSNNGGAAYMQGGARNSGGQDGNTELRDADGVARVTVSGGNDRNVTLNGEVTVDLQIGGNSIAYANSAGFHPIGIIGASSGTNVFFHAAPSGWDSMEKGIFIGDCDVEPTGGDAGGVYLYSVGGALYAMDGSGVPWPLTGS